MKTTKLNSINTRVFLVVTTFLVAAAATSGPAQTNRSVASTTVSSQTVDPSVATEFEQARQTFRGFRVESVEEFIKVKHYHEQVISDGKITHKFRTADGHLVHCIEIGSQGSAKRAGIDLKSIRFAPEIPPSDSQDTNVQNTANPAAFGMDGSFDADGNVRSCPRGSIPVLIPSLEDLCRFRKLEDRFRKYPPNTNPAPGASTNEIRGHLGPPGPSGLEPPSGHEYAHAYYYVDNQGEQADFNCWQPAVQQTDEFSLAQLWVTRGSGTGQQTAETGWQVYYGLYGDWQTHLFIYTTQNGYSPPTPGYYNLSSGTPFVQTDSSVIIGGTISPLSTYGGVQYAVTLMFYRDQGGSHNWWLKYGNTWIGYYPNSWFNSSGLADKGAEIDYGGEVVNDSIGGVHTTTQMGSGHFPSEGWQHSAYVKRIQYVDMNNVNQNASSLTRSVSGASYYDLTLYASSDTNWLNYYFCGGPGLVIPVSITSQPQSQTVTVGSTVTFFVAASGSQPLWYQWRLNAANISGATNASYTISNVQTSQAGNYTVVVTNTGGAATSATAVLTVNVPPSITAQPQSRTITAGNSVTFSVTASGTAPLSYQWYRNNSSIAGATAASYTITGVQPTDAGDYKVTVSNVAGELDSASATLTVQYAPVITAQPQSQNAKIGETVTFSVVAAAIPAPTYQWKFDSVNIPGAISSSCTLISFQPTNVGNYTVVVGNSLGSVTSSNAVLAVAVCVPAPPGLVGWWPGEGDATDIAGRNDGALQGGVGFGPGKVGQAFSFDGTTGYIRIADNPNLHFTNALTIEAWIYPTSLGAYHEVVSKWGWLGANAQMAYSTTVLPSGQIGFGVCSDGGCSPNPYVLGTNSIPVNQWTHFAATYDGSNLRMYVNGVCQNQTAYNNGMFPGTNDLLIGAAWGGPGQIISRFVGLIDEPAVYNRALSDAEIAAIYNASSAGKCSLPPTVLTQPANQTVIVGTIATFAVAAGGTPPLGYQWYRNNWAIAGATNASYSISATQPSDMGSFDVIVSNNSGSVTSALVTLTVWIPPAITQQPVSLVVTQGSGASFSVSASGDTPLGYQWYRNNWAVAGATNASYMISVTQPSDMGSYDVIVSNNSGSVTSALATLTVEYAPIIIIQPRSQTVNQGASVSFSVQASGVPTPAFQWRLNAAPITGATSPVLTRTNVQPSDAGNYSVAISNALGQTNSANAFLAVLVPFPGTYDTGLSDSRTLLADGQVDPHYKLVVNPNNPASSDSVVQDSTAFPIAGGPWIQNSSISKWIGPALNTVGAAAGNYSYQLTVDLTGCDPRTAFLAGSWAADDGGSIFLNGVDTGFSCTNYFVSFSTFTLTNGFALGTNLIEFRVGNASSWTGLRVENLRGTVQTESVPFVGTQPEGATNVIGDNVTFAVVAGGASPLSYQWRFNGTDIPTASGASLELTNVQLSQAGNYDVIVSNHYGSVTSAVATLMVRIWADVYYDFETAATSPVWLGTTQMIQNTSASHQGTNAIAFTGTYPDAYLLIQLPQGTKNVEFYFYDDYGPNPPLYQYMFFWLLEATNAEPFAGFTMNDGGWGTTPPRTMNHYYAYGNEEYSARTMGPIRTIGWHKFTFAVGAESVAMSVDGTLVFQTNMIQVARYLELSPGGGCAGWGRMDDLVLTGVTVAQPTLTISRAGTGIRVAWPVSASGFVLQETISPLGNWANSLAAVVVQGNENVAVIATTSTAKFYRLRK
jgi:hypothetical protein